MTSVSHSLSESVLSGDHVVICLAACWIVFAVSTPLTYVGGARWLHRAVQLGGGKTQVRPGWSWGTMGGVRTLVFQALSLSAWLLSCAVVVPILSAARHDWMSSLTVELLVAAAAVGAVSSQLFQVSAVLVFDPAAKPMRILAGLQQGHTDVLWDVKSLPSSAAASYVVIGMGSLWVALGAALLHLGANLLEDAPVRLAYLALSGACLTMAAFVTYGLAGHLRHVHRKSEPGSESDSEGGDEAAPAAWHFFQPFKGGGWFVATQALGWALYSAGLSLIIYLMAHSAIGIVHSAQRFAQTAGIFMVFSHLVLAGSLLLYKGPVRTMELVRGLSASLSERALRPTDLRTRLSDALVITLLYAPVQLLCTIIALYFLLFPLEIALTLLLASAFVYYSITLIGGPFGETGRREWPLFRDWFGRRSEEVLPAWVGSLEILRDGEADQYDPERRHVFGFAVHGLYPLAAGYLPLLPGFRRLLPGIRPVTLCASVVFAVPLLRDLLAWLGLRVVSRRSFLRALREKGAVLLVPGGQAELVHTHRIARPTREFCVYRSHKGFVRLALQSEAALVPVLALGEVDSLQNLVNLPGMLRWTYKRLGFPVPYLIGGRYNVSPFPRPTGLRFVIGKPILPATKVGPDGPSQAQIDDAHARFYASLEDLFARYAPSFPGYEDVKFVPIDH